MPVTTGKIANDAELKLTTVSIAKGPQQSKVGAIDLNRPRAVRVNRPYLATTNL